MPAGFNKFEYPSITNDFYGDGIPFGQVQSGSQADYTPRHTIEHGKRRSQSRVENNTNTNTTTTNQPTNR